MLKHLSLSPLLFCVASIKSSFTSLSRFPSSYPNPNPRPNFNTVTKMSSRTVADVLMAAARAKAARKGEPPSKRAKIVDETLKKDAVIFDELAKPTGNNSVGGGRGVGSEGFDLEAKICQLTRKPAEFKPKSAAFWNESEHVPFLFLARALDLIANESGRIAMRDIMCNVFRIVIATTPDDLLAVVYLSANKIAPAYKGVELGIGDAAIIKVLAEACGRNEMHIKTQLKVADMHRNQKINHSINQDEEED